MRRLSLIAGIGILAVIWLGPLLAAWRDSFAAGMAAHMGVIALASPMIAIGLPEQWRPGHSMPAILPILASIFELAVVWGWHAPSMREFAETSMAGTVAEQATFLAAGLLLWTTSFCAPQQRMHAAVGAAALLLTSIHMTLLGALLALSPRPLYGSGQVTCFGLVLTAGQDQQLGGVMMLIVGAVVYLTGGIVLIGQLLAPDAQTASQAPSNRDQSLHPR